ncbi:MAG: hypothetical protein Q9227_008377 [Pyrenula ochraceoflavens]
MRLATYLLPLAAIQCVGARTFRRVHNVTPRVDTAISASALVDSGLKALGGEDALRSLEGVTYSVPEIYRSKSLMQSYSLFHSDTFNAISGEQNISFSFATKDLQQRIDRNIQRSSYWYFAIPTVPPISFSLVVRGGQEGFSCYVNRNDQLSYPPDLTLGYVDGNFPQSTHFMNIDLLRLGALADWLAYQGSMMSPALLLSFKDSNDTSASMLELRPGVQLPAVHDANQNLTIFFNATTNFPYVVRSIEDNEVFGKISNDIVLYNYTPVNGISFPQRIQNIYNDTAVLEDFVVQEITTNPAFPTGFFDGIASNSTSLYPKAVPKPDPEYGHAELHEYWSNGLYRGLYTGTLANLTVQYPLDDLPSLRYLQFSDAPSYSQIVVEIGEGVVVMDSPKHQTQLVIQWIKDTLKKPITHIFVCSAKLIVPENAVWYWSQNTNASFEVIRENQPVILRDNITQARFMWTSGAVHAEDWAYAIVTSANPSANSGIMAFEADAINTGGFSPAPDVDEFKQFVQQAEADGLARSAVYVEKNIL